MIVTAWGAVASLVAPARGAGPLLHHPPRWSGQVEVLSDEPPLFILRGLLSQAESEQVIKEYDVELLPEFERNTNASSPVIFEKCASKFRPERCSAVQEAGDHCDFLQDPDLYNTQTTQLLDERISTSIGVPVDHIEATWFFNWGDDHIPQRLHVDNYHHYMHPRRIASVLVRLRPDPVGVVFPLARMHRGAHPIAEDEEYLQTLNDNANSLPFKGMGASRHFTSGPLHDAYLELCNTRPLRLHQGDALLYYHLSAEGDIDMRALHSSCATDSVKEPKIFAAKFVRGASLPDLYQSRMTPEPLRELREWINLRKGLGMDVNVLAADPGRVLQIRDSRVCPEPVTLWMVSLTKLQNGARQHPVICDLPQEHMYVERQPGEAFEMNVLFLNTGMLAWPADTVISLRDGDAMTFPVGVRIGVEVPHGETMQINFRFVAPSTYGTRAYGVWSFADVDRRPFGSLLWVDVSTPPAPEPERISDAADPGVELETETMVDVAPDVSAGGLSDATGDTGASAPVAADANPDDALARDDVIDSQDSSQITSFAQKDGNECEDFWHASPFLELSSQISVLPTMGGGHRGNPRLCWALGHRFWFAALTVHEEKEHAFILGFCTPTSCTDSEAVRQQVAAPWASEAFARSGKETRSARLELSEWTRPWTGVWKGEAFVLGVILALVLAAVLAELFGLGDVLPAPLRGFSLMRGWQVLRRPVGVAPRAAGLSWLRLSATGSLIFYHVNQYPVYKAPGLPWFLQWLRLRIFSICHDPLFTVLSVHLLLAGSWSPAKLAGKVFRKWARLAPVGLASRALLCGLLRGAPMTPFLLDVQPRINENLCAVTRCTHHACTPLYGLYDVALAFPPLDHAGWFIEQDMTQAVVLAVLAAAFGSGKILLQILAGSCLAVWIIALVTVLPRCVGPDARVDGPCVAAPFSSYVDLPEGSVCALCVFTWHLLAPAALLNQRSFAFWPFAGIAVALAMEAWGLPSTVTSGIQLVEHSTLASSRLLISALPCTWWAVGRLALAFSLCRLASGLTAAARHHKQMSNGAEGVETSHHVWGCRLLSALDRLCLGVCVVHVRVLELLCTYLRPDQREFSWDTFLMDYVTVALLALGIALALFLLVQAPAETAVLWTFGF